MPLLGPAGARIGWAISWKRPTPKGSKPTSGESVEKLPPVALFIVLRRYMVRGLSLGVVKG